MADSCASPTVFFLKVIATVELYLYDYDISSEKICHSSTKSWVLSTEYSTGATGLKMDALTNRHVVIF